MTKSEAILKLQEKHGSAAREVVEDFLTIVKQSISQREPIFIRDLGTFKPIRRKAKKGQLMEQGLGSKFLAKKTIDIPARNTVKFVPSKRLLASIEVFDADEF